MEYFFWFVFFCFCFFAALLLCNSLITKSLACIALFTASAFAKCMGVFPLIDGHTKKTVGKQHKIEKQNIQCHTHTHTRTYEKK